MWYKIDFVKLVAFLLPPILRSAFLLALLRVLLVPIRHVYDLFIQHKDGADENLNVSGNVIVLENVLNRYFCLENRQIYIVTPEEKNRSSYLHFKREQKFSLKMYLAKEEKGVYLIHEYDSSTPINFIVMVPTFLCTSTETKEADKYGWKNLNAIKKILNIYKPAGRTFSINLYDYE